MLRVVEKDWDGDDCMHNQWAEILSIGVLALVPKIHHRRSIRALVLGWQMLHVMWDLIVTINKTFRVKDGVLVGRCCRRSRQDAPRR